MITKHTLNKCDEAAEKMQKLMDHWMEGPSNKDQTYSDIDPVAGQTIVFDKEVYISGIRFSAGMYKLIKISDKIPNFEF